MTLSDCIIYESTAALAAMLEQVKDVSYVDEYGYTPLIETAIANQVDKGKLLIEKGADVDQKDTTGRTALHWAAQNNNVEFCQALLEAGADPNLYGISGESALVKPILRHHEQLKTLFARFGASFIFANDYINAKLLGHRFELIGSVDIADTRNMYTEIDYEGFYFEFSLDLIRDSLMNYQNNFAARGITPWFEHINVLLDAFGRATRLLHYDHYLIDYTQHIEVINRLLNSNPLVIPVSQEGHAITMVKCGDYFSIIDRAKHDAQNDTIPIYKITKPAAITNEVLCELIYRKQQLDWFHKVLPIEFGLKQVATIPMHAQIIGNCSWANVEAVVPVLFIMLELSYGKRHTREEDIMTDAMELFQRWREWDRERALQFCMQSFGLADPARRASKAAILAGILFQRCPANHPEGVERAKRILSLIYNNEFRYLIDSYKTYYLHRTRTKAGENFEELLRLYSLEHD